jgi:hypothetical protein
MPASTQWLSPRISTKLHHVTSIRFETQIATLAKGMLLAATLAAMTPHAGRASADQPPIEAQAAEEAEASDASAPAMASEVTVPDDKDIDWAALNAPLDRPYVPTAKLRSGPVLDASNPAAWSRSDKPNGAAALSLKQPVSPFWDTKAGLDLDVATQASPLTTPETLPEKLANDRRLQNSQGTAWITARAPGVPYLSDHVALEARMNPSSDTRLGAAFSKSVPLWGEQFSLTLRNGYTVTQHDGLPGLPGAQGSSLDMERSARLNVTDTGTTFIAGQSLSATGSRWLNTVGAQQSLFGGLNISGSISEREGGVSDKSFTAGFKKSW